MRTRGPRVPTSPTAIAQPGRDELPARPLETSRGKAAIYFSRTRRGRAFASHGSLLRCCRRRRNACSPCGGVVLAVVLFLVSFYSDYGLLAFLVRILVFFVFTHNPKPSSWAIKRSRMTCSRSGSSAKTRMSSRRRLDVTSGCSIR